MQSLLQLSADVVVFCFKLVGLCQGDVMPPGDQSRQRRSQKTMSEFPARLDSGLVGAVAELRGGSRSHQGTLCGLVGERLFPPNRRRSVDRQGPRHRLLTPWCSSSFRVGLEIA
ncbi:hypothetical protein P170DRAFT_207102 [Aspergillus steynii IBT 23096]|uniref:Secreted protein n=1 Tax=Aspergillus steynii IBT 23096 TaxID=1392250 RepID=A0A2I2G5J1_9EURO|nr:uncharacterized protein P170DRAFT_207102 [Aspergillus steynii IBT 23096]PLB48146.1 hypothetical protein P170DRAFT_207102 [Aspergillus steynii IBT 23096]